MKHLLQFALALFVSLTLCASCNSNDVDEVGDRPDVPEERPDITPEIPDSLQNNSQPGDSTPTNPQPDDSNSSNSSNSSDPNYHIYVGFVKV